MLTELGVDEDAVALTVPGAVRRVAELAGDLGWRVVFQFADGPPPSVVLKVARGRQRAYGLWLLEDGCKYRGGASNRLDLGAFRTLAMLRGYLAEPDDGGEVRW